jgi:uncharacterized damage-inducible protein DinB
MEKIVKDLLYDWKATRQRTLDWIDSLPLEQLNQRLPRPGLNSFTNHIYEMGEAQKVYTSALKGVEPDLTRIIHLTFDSSQVVAKTKEELINFLNDCDREFYGAIDEIYDWWEEVYIFGENRPKYSVIELMIRHEILHHGQFIAFGYMLGISFPKSWIDAWALPVK